MTAESGVISTQMRVLENMIANSANFQAWVGQIDADSARPFIHHFDYKVNAFMPFPNVVIFEETATRFTLIAPHARVPGGTLGMMFQDEIPDGDLDADTKAISDIKETLVKFGNVLGPILEDINNALNQGGNLWSSEGIIPADDGARSIEDHDVTGSDVPRTMWLRYLLPWGD